LKLIVLPEAQEDQRQAVAFYRKESLALARRFMSDRSAVMKRIADAPQQFPFVGNGNQRGLLSVFPYNVIFRQMSGFIAVVALAHTSRKPDYWNDRDIPDTL
jgi:toxin ParE1/3/4